MEVQEVLRLSAVDNDFFNHTFFPRAFRQPSAKKHREIDDALNDPAVRRVLLKCFRGSAKTTRMRAFAAKRIAFYVSRTIFYVGASDDDAIRSIMWLRNQIERNSLYSETFQLRRGSKWSDHELEIIHGVEQQPIWVRGAGITGSVRGINFEDYRPDLILLDDVITDETAATLEQREKVANLILGAIEKSLAPVSEAPNAKIAFSQTPLAQGDASDEAARSPRWETIEFPCWTPETMDLPVHQQRSAWPERFSDEELQRDKIAHSEMNRLSVWNREMEVRLTSAETAAFRPEWLKYRQEEPIPGSMYCIMAIDPVPPPSERQLQKNLHGKDFEVIMVVGRRGEDYHVLEYAANRGHEPNWTEAKVLELAQKWRVAKIVYEPVNYQRTLGYHLRTAMQRAKTYFAVIEAPIEKMAKYHRIVNTVSGPASAGHLWCGPHMVELRDQFDRYKDVDHDDILDALSLALADLVNPFLELGPDAYTELDDDVTPLRLEGLAP